jgi:hypothetical protein
MKPLIEPGRCSACGSPAERGRSGVWWHARQADSCGRNPARFEADPQPERQQESPRNRQIPHPPEDR